MSDDKFSRTKAASEAASIERNSARESAIESIRKMLQALSMALNGSSLMGLPNLGRGSVQYRGVRATSRDAAEGLPRCEPGKDGREVLCLSIKGELEYVRWARDRSLKVRPAVESEYLAEWPEDIAEAILSAIDYHLEGANVAMERYGKLRELSQMLSNALTQGDE